MPIDDLWTENLDELINDENKVVTFKSLSYHLKVHCNVAKQMLYTFLTQERDKKGKDSLSATYFISGLTKPDADGTQVFKCLVIKEDKLEEKKKSFTVVTSCHIYSIQKSKLKDSNSLYMTDYEKFKENVFECNRYSSIQYDKAKPRTDDDMDLLMVNMPATEPDKKPAPVGNAGSSKPQTKKGPQSAIANMFAKVDNTKKQTNKAEKAVKQEVEKKESNKGPSKCNKKGDTGMMGFLNKEKNSKQTKPSMQEEKKKTPEKKESPVKKKEPSPAVSKKSQRKEDSDDEDIFRSKKRRRTKQDIFESSSEGEEMEAEPENPVPAKEPSPEPEIIEDEEEPVPKIPPPTKESEKDMSSKGEKKRRRKRKLVPKTYLDKDGFMVTEKVWESDSTDASEVEEPVKKPSPKPPTPEKGKKGSPKKKVSPGKKGQQGSGKQTSLMSFFKKS